MQRRTEALTLIDWERLEDDHNRWSPVRIFCGPKVFDHDFHPLYRRFLSACCRQLDHLLTDDVRAQLNVIEAFAYSRAPFADFVVARNAAKLSARRLAKQRGVGLRYHATAAVRDSARNDGFEALLLCCCQLRQAGLTERKMAETFERVATEWVAEEK